MKKLLLTISLFVFSQSGFIEEYPNSWKMNIQCKDSRDTWSEGHFVVDLADVVYLTPTSPNAFDPSIRRFN